DVLHKLCNYSIKGKSHNEVAKKFFFARGVVSGLLDSGKINYTKDWKNDIKSIMVYDRETFNILKQLKKELDKIGD
ncbi:hypothetical protein, partial [Treponema sp.]|uniref:hypothetical protein n=1 Tax=Treponema sp. TaxID=166 RepID=UPI0025CF56F0